MHTRLVVAAACLASAGLLFAQPMARAEGPPGVGTPRPVTAARAGAVTLGQVAAVTPVACSPGPTTTAQYLEGGAPTYVTPAAGVITSFSVRAGSGPNLARLVVFGPSATAGHRTVVAMSAQNAVVVNTVNTFATRVPVAAGLSIGLNNSASSICWGAGVAGDQVSAAIFDPGASG